jgi:hypothetical protein
MSTHVIELIIQSNPASDNTDVGTFDSSIGVSAPSALPQSIILALKCSAHIYLTHIPPGMNLVNFYFITVLERSYSRGPEFYLLLSSHCHPQPPCWCCCPAAPWPLTKPYLFPSRQMHGHNRKPSYSPPLNLLLLPPPAPAPPPRPPLSFPPQLPRRLRF